MLHHTVILSPSTDTTPALTKQIHAEITFCREQEQPSRFNGTGQYSGQGTQSIQARTSDPIIAMIFES